MTASYRFLPVRSCDNFFMFVSSITDPCSIQPFQQHFPLFLNYSEFPNSCLGDKFPFFIDVFDMFIDGRHCHLKQLRYQFLGQPDRLILKPHFDPLPAILGLVEKDPAVCRQDIPASPLKLSPRRGGCPEGSSLKACCFFIYSLPPYSLSPSKRDGREIPEAYDNSQIKI